MKTNGFTLLELLVAAALVAVAATVVASAFAAGFRVWQRASQMGGAASDALIALELMEKDVHNTTPCRLVPFSGNGSWVEIPAVVPVPLATGTQDQPGSIRYEFNSREHGVDRIPRYFPFPGSGQQTQEALLTQVEDVRFSYGEGDARGGGTVNWTGSWVGRTNVPAAMKVELTILQGGQRIDLERTIVLPVQ